MRIKPRHHADPATKRENEEIIDASADMTAEHNEIVPIISSFAPELVKSRAASRNDAASIYHHK